MAHVLGRKRLIISLPDPISRYLGQVFAVSTRAVFTRGNYLSLQAHSVWVIILRRWVSTQPNLAAVITPLLRDGA